MKLPIHNQALPQWVPIIVLAVTALLLINISLFWAAHEPLIHPFNLKRFIQLSGCCLVLLFICYSRQARINIASVFQHQNYNRLLLIAALLAITSSLLAASPLYSFFEITLILCCVLWGVAVGYSPITLERLYALPIIVISVFTIFSMLQVSVYALSNIEPSGLDIVYGFSNPRFLNHVQTIALPLLVSFAAFHHRKKLLVSIVIGVATLLFSQVILSGARGTLLSVLVATITFIAVTKGSQKRVLYYLAATIILGSAITYVLTNAWQTPSNASAVVAASDHTLIRASSSGRFELWLSSLNPILQNPWFGIGPNHFGHDQEGMVKSPHNLLVLVAIEYGIPILVLLLSGIFIAAKSLLSTLNSDVNNPLNQGVFIAVLAAFTHSMFSGIMLAPAGQIFLCMLLAIWIKLSPRIDTVLMKNKAPWIVLGVASVMLIITATTLIFASSHLFVTGCSGDGTLPTPRLWLSGHLPCH